MRWIFEQRLAGRSVAGIARDLNERGVPCPSSADPERNPHRGGQAWLITTVAAILANPRYTGRQVWNRQHTDRDRVDDQGELFREQEVRRWTPSAQWVISRAVVHPPLVSEEQFVRVQAVHTAPVPADGQPRHYLVAGLVFCGTCGRLMDSHWVHDRPGYRCRHGHISAQPGSRTHPKILYMREDHLLERIRGDRRLRRQIPGLGSHGADEVTQCLRANGMIVVCDHTTWAVESDTIRIELASTTMPGLIPTQMRASPEESERSSRSVWK